MKRAVNMSELGEKSKFLIQIGISVGIALLLEFILPVTWQPFYSTVGDVFGAETGLGIAGLSI